MLVLLIVIVHLSVFLYILDQLEVFLLKKCDKKLIILPEVKE